MGNIPDKIFEKVPSYNEYKSNTKSAISYIFMLIFVGYFCYKEFIAQDDCSVKVKALDATFTKTLEQKDDMIEKLNERVSALEVALDVRNGVIKQVETKADNLIASNGG